MKIIASIIAVSIFCFLASGCTNDDVCSQLKNKSQDIELINKLESWVDRKQQSGELVIDKSNPSPDPPGTYLIKKDSDLDQIIGPDMQASIITGADSGIEAVFFFKGSYRGIVVFLNGKSNSMINDEKLKPVSERTQLLCIERD